MRPLIAKGDRLSYPGEGSCTIEELDLDPKTKEGVFLLLNQKMEGFYVQLADLCAQLDEPSVRGSIYRSSDHRKVRASA